MKLRQMLLRKPGQTGSYFIFVIISDGLRQRPVHEGIADTVRRDLRREGEEERALREETIPAREAAERKYCRTGIRLSTVG